VDDDLFAVQPVTDLGRRQGSRELAWAAKGGDLAVAQHGDSVAKALGLVEVVRSEEDRLTEVP
jgi:hypothetical protein